MRTSVKSSGTLLDANFITRNLLTGMAAFVAPVVAAYGAMAAVYRPNVDVLKAVARMRHPDRLSLSAREAVLKDADEHGLDLTKAFESMHLSDVERTAMRHMLQREESRQS